MKIITFLIFLISFILMGIKSSLGTPVNNKSDFSIILNGAKFLDAQSNYIRLVIKRLYREELSYYYSLEEYKLGAKIGNYKQNREINFYSSKELCLEKLRNYELKNPEYIYVCHPLKVDNDNNFQLSINVFGEVDQDCVDSLMEFSSTLIKSKDFVNEFNKNEISQIVIELIDDPKGGNQLDEIDRTNDRVVVDEILTLSSPIIFTKLCGNLVSKQEDSNEEHLLFDFETFKKSIEEME